MPQIHAYVMPKPGASRHLYANQVCAVPPNDVRDCPYRVAMATKRIQVGLSTAHQKLLDKLAVKLGLDWTNTLRYCLNRVAEIEGLSKPENPERHR